MKVYIAYATAYSEMMCGWDWLEDRGFDACEDLGLISFDKASVVGKYITAHDSAIKLAVFDTEDDSFEILDR